MIIQAEQKYIRISPRKIRIVANAIKGKSLEEAVYALSVVRKFSAEPLLKTLNQAVANAVNNNKLNSKDLQIDQIMINEGPTIKRWRAVSRGRGRSILKRTSHIKVTLKLEPKSVAVTPKPKAQATSEKAPKKTTKATNISKLNKGN